MVIGIFVGGIFLGFSLGFATMALVSARNDRLQGEEAQETTGHLSAQLLPSVGLTVRFRPGRRPPESHVCLLPDL